MKLRYVLHALGMPFNGETISQGKSLGGSESAAYYVAKELASRGHSVKIFTNIPPEMEGTWDGVRYYSAGEIGDNNPIGNNFLQYASKIPHDVLIMQRHPQAFGFNPNSKVNLWWTHDLALKRQMGMINSQLFNIDRILAVSKFHANQICKVYGTKKELVDVLPNGVDQSLFCHDIPDIERVKNKVMVYTSRPERGLENLVKPGGIMEMLLDKNPDIILKVAGYDNTRPETESMYQALWKRCEELPNVELLGSLSKKDLSYLMSTAWLHVYPTTFEETSCITAMEEQCAGTPFMATVAGALPETLSGGGVKWVKGPKGGQVDIEGFTKSIQALAKNDVQWNDLHTQALEIAPNYTWHKSVNALEETVSKCFTDNTSNDARLARHLIHNSDIMIANRLAEEKGLPDIQAEIKEHYAYAFVDGFAEHYDNLAKWEAETGRGHGHGGDHLYNIPRFQPILQVLQELPDGSGVLDYACGQGHFTEAAARRFPKLFFFGVDISEENIKVGNDYIDTLGGKVPNVSLYTTKEIIDPGQFDLVIAAEILEHVINPSELADELEAYCKVGGQVITTTPSGPWEASTYDTHPYRMHIHHLEETDLIDLFGNKPGFETLYIPVEQTQKGEALGCFATRWKVEENQPPSGEIDYQRKINIQSPRQTLSVCMIVKTDGDTLAKTLETTKPFADEFIIGIDGPEGEGRAWSIAKEYGAKAYPAKSPLDIGFDEARNETIKRASSDWVLWIDDDESFDWPDRMGKYLRPNNFDSYAIKQHHFAAEPAGVIKTDYPCRIFRNTKDTRFYGVVHEHPEKGGINKGCGNVMFLPDVSICHNGYSTEEVRRRRFERNLPLMIRDREKYPNRKLGKFLWVRDLAHRCRYELEATQQMSARVVKHCEDAISLWREVVSESDGVRMATDALPYYSECVNHLTQGAGINFSISVGVNFMGLGNMNGQPPEPINGMFFNKEDISLFNKALIEDSTQFIEGGYL